MKIPFLTNYLETQVKREANRLLEKALDSQFRTQDASNYLNEQTYAPENKIDFALAFEKSVWLCACVHAIAANCAKVPLKIYKKGSDIEITDGEVWEALNVPNSEQSIYDLLEAVVAYMELTGDAFLEISQERNGFKNLRPYWVEIRYNKYNKTRSYVYKPNGVIENTFEEKDIIHFKYFSPNSDFYGYSSVQSVTDALIQDFNCNRYTKEFFKKGGMINLYLKVKNSLQDFEFKRLKQETQTNFAGVNNAHTIPVLDNDAEFKNAGSDVDKILLKTVKDKSRDEILTAMGVPPIMLSTLAGYETYNNSEIQKRVFWENTIQPKLIKIQNTLNRCFFWALGYEVLFDFSDIDALKDDDLKKAQIAMNLINSKVMTPNEVRELYYDLNPIEGGDALVTAQPATQFSMSKSDPVRKAMRVSLIKAAVEDHNKGYADNLERTELAVIDVFHKTSNAILNTIKKDDDILAQAIGKLPEMEKQMMKELSEQNTTSSEYYVRSNFRRQTGRDIPSAKLAKVMTKNKERIDKWAEQSSTSITNTMKERLTTLLSKENLEIEEATKGIQEIFEGTSFAHARMIARTELGTIANESRLEVAKENDFKKKTWIATTDSHSRDFHDGVMNGVTVDIDEPFDVAGIQMQYPGDPAGGPGNNCNCRCTFVES